MQTALTPLHRAAAWLCLLPALLACGEQDTTEGELIVSAYGEAFIEEGIPADEMADGWEVRFERFEVAIEDVWVAGSEVEVDPSVELTSPSQGQGHPIGTAFLPTGDYTEPSFTIARVELAGSATKDGAEKTFEWTFETPTLYEECDTTTTVQAGSPASFEITVHADHLFYDSLVAEDPALRFEALADADADADGRITRQELQAADLGAYDPGSDGDIDDLWAYLEAQARTLGHVDGEGHCHAHDD